MSSTSAELLVESAPGCDAGIGILRRLQAAALADRTPISGSIALTHRCNLRCVHCYARTNAAGGAELSTPQALSVIDEMADAGCLFLLLTGGEPLLRPDFAAIYAHARRKGILVSVFTNGTLIDDAILRLFREYPPRVVDITLYGITDATCARVTGVRGVPSKVLPAIDRLREQGTRVSLKTVVLTLNQSEFPDIQEFAVERGIRFRLDAAVFPRFDGDRGPLRFRLPPNEAVALEMGRPERARQWREYIEEQKRIPPTDALYSCVAGLCSFHVDPAGDLLPCLMAGHIRHSLKEGGFREGWRRLTADMQRRKRPAGYGCAQCEKRPACGYCPAFARLETGEETKPSEYLCALGDARLRALTPMEPAVR